MATGGEGIIFFTGVDTGKNPMPLYITLYPCSYKKLNKFNGAHTYTKTGRRKKGLLEDSFRDRGVGGG